MGGFLVLGSAGGQGWKAIRVVAWGLYLVFALVVGRMLSDPLLSMATFIAFSLVAVVTEGETEEPDGEEFV